tara:strand:- start:354 stop:1037 length:684 start_codon:yes stop_codon:yes gene_type:complete
MNITPRQITVGRNLPIPPPQLDPSKELLRVRLSRILDDGTQTLGIMDVLGTNENQILFSLATVELPYKGNQPKVSCIPTDNYRVVSYATGKWGNCFWLIGNEKGDYVKNQISGDGFTRGSILIHAGSKATSNLQGCIGPGLKFNAQTKQRGNQKGTGMYYLSPSKEQSKQAMNILVSTLWDVGSFKMEINDINITKPLMLKEFSLYERFERLALSKNLLPNPYIGPK